MSSLVSATEQEIEAASQLALASEVAHGYNVLSVLHQENGDFTASQQATELAASAAYEIVMFIPRARDTALESNE